MNNFFYGIAKRLFPNFNKTEISWVYYDWANSAYTLTVMTVLFPLLWTAVAKNAGLTEDTYNRIFLYVTGFMSLGIAILSPIIGAMSDFKNYKMKFFKGTLFLGVIFAFLLCIPGIPWQALLGVYTAATVFYTFSCLFYDAFLTDVTTEDKFHQVSAGGYAWGYIGSVFPFILGMIVYGAVFMGFNIGLTDVQAISIAFAISIIWWFVFSFPMLKNVKQNYYVDKTPNWLADSFVRLGRTVRKIARRPKLGFYLLAYFFYIDAVYTIIKTAVQIGQSFKTPAGTPEVSDIALVAVVFIVQLIAFPCAIIFGKLTNKFGEVKMLSIGIISYTLICGFGYFLGSVTGNINIDLMIFGFVVGLFQGGIQAVSRSYYGKLIPKNESGEYYGFFNIFGRFASVMGPFVMSWVLDKTNNTHFATVSLIPLLIIGLIFFMISSAFHKTDKIDNPPLADL